MKDHLKQGDIVAERYEILEKTGEGGMSLVFKARDKEKKTNVAIKFLKPGVTSSYIEDRIRFKKEVEVVSKFNHPNIVKIFSAGEYKQIPFIVMELLEGESLYDILSRSRVFTTRETVIIIKQILDALSYVHFRGVIHRDLKPANVMIMANKNVKLLDFGIALVKELSEIKKEEEVLGTFGYMSPEATGIVNKPVDERSDLYSLGILFYRLVTGDLPFKGKRTSEILHKQVAMTPQRPGELNKDLSKEMDNVIMKLLEKEPDLRYQSSVGLISDLDRILKGEKGFIIGEKDQKTKLTYRVRLIGRQREYNQITSLFDKAMGGCGSVCLIGGEAGIGKSRLVEELRALVYEHKGCFFVGKCFDQENKVPYQPFKDILDQYLRKIKHFCDKDIQEEAKRLKSELREQIGEIVKLNSNMTNLLGELPDLVKLDAVEKENVRFRMACAKFFSVLSKDKGVVLFLDDLQWADEGSLNLLGEILKVVDRSHVLILGTYRNNEVDERHSLLRIKKFGIENQLPLITIDLQLFNYERMRKLVSEVLGENEKKAEKLTRYIINKTKGNTFFAITLLRELVERNALVWEKGYWRENWEQIEKLKVSANIVDMLLLRLKELPEKVDILLRIGSIIGKEFDIDLLYDLLGEEEEIVVELIDEAIEKQLLERSTEKGKVVFIHDRIKEAFYAKMGSKERIKYHFKVARVFEEKYRDRIDSVIFDLAHHFIEGKDKEKGLKYGLPAAHKAKENYANREAINYYSYVKKILREKGEKDKLYIQVLEGLGDVCRLEGRYPEALENFKQLASLIKDRLHKGRVYHKISDTLFQMGERDEPVKVLDQSLQILKLRRLPRTKSGFFLAFGVRFTIQMLHLFLPWIFINQRYKDDERREIGCKIYMRLGYCYYFIDMIASATAGMMSVNMVDKMKDTVVYSYIHILQSPIYVAIGVFSLGIKYLKMGLKTALKLKDKLMEGFAYAYYCYLFYAWNKLDRSIEAGHKSVNILRSLGERWEIAVAYVFIWWAEYTRGDTIKMKKVLSEYLPLMRQVNDNRTLGWALNGMGKTLTITGSLDNKNFEYLNEGLECEKQVKDPVFIAMLYGSLGRAYLQKGELELAIENGENGVDYFVNSAAPGYWACEVFGIAAEAYQAKIETGRISEEERIKYLKRVTWLCKKALKWGKGYKTFYGLGLRAAAKCCWLKEKKKKAVCYFEKGIRFLERNDHKYELAVTCYDFGRLLMKKEYNRIYNHEKGKALLMRAKAIMEEIGAKPDLARVNHLLGVEEITKEITDEVTPRERLQLEREMTTVLDTITFISSILDLDVLLEKVIDKATQLSGAERGILFLYPETEQKERILEARVVRNVKEREIEEEGFTTSRGVIYKVEKEKKALIIEDATLDEKLKKEDSVVKYGLRSVLCIPILHRDDLLGIIYLDNRLVSGLFTQENLRVLEVLAKQAGISISNAILYKRAITDGLTGLYNHNFFQNYLMKSTERANRFNNELSLLMIDIDHFKECNDTYGHRAGDEVLHNVSEILQKTARRSDLVARYGGEEFAIILPETGLEGARIAAEKIREAIETSRVKTKVGKKDEEIQVTVSVGVAELEPGEEPISLIERSDQALYKAKERGRNCVKVFGEKKGTTAGRKKITQKSRKAVTKSKIQRSRRKKK